MVFFYPLIFPQERARIKNNRGKKYEKKKKKKRKKQSNYNYFIMFAFSFYSWICSLSTINLNKSWDNALLTS